MVLPPSRPDAWQLSIIGKSLNEVRRQEPVAVLGSTPEFRDLLAQLRFEHIHVFERNETFHELVSKERIYENKETVIWGDWLDTLHQMDMQYGAVLSDLTSGNINYSDRGRFYSGVARVLRRDGYFFDRVLSHSIPHEMLDFLYKKYDALPLNLTTINHFSCEFLFCSELLLEDQIVDSTRFYDILRKKLSTRRLQRFLEFCPLITPNDCIWWYGRPWSALVDDYERDLAILDVTNEPANTPYAGRARLLISRRR